jgi:two-component system cell cycle response regulator
MDKVLTVDDSKVVRSMVARHLQGYGVEVVEAANGQEGVEAARAHKPKLILLDVTMPVMDGRQALAEIRKDPECSAIPVIMLTAESGKEIVVEIAKLKVSGYIIKPFQKDTFDKEVSKVLGAPSGQASVQAPTAADKAKPVDHGVVLVIDDSERVLDAARVALEKSMRVLTATSGKQGLEEYHKSRPGVVVIDLEMPEMDGFETLTQMKQLGQSEFLALAVKGDAALHEKARKAGYHAVVDKPINAGELANQVVQAASAGASPEDLAKLMFGEEEGCSVLSLPNPRSKNFARVAPILGKRMRALAADGFDRLILDLAQVVEVNADVVTMLASVVSEAKGMGIRTAICTAQDGIVQNLKQIAETKDIPCAPNREAARASLQ